MKISKEDVVIGIIIISLALNVYFIWNIRYSRTENDSYVNTLKAQRDSIINADILKVQNIQKVYEAKADSAINISMDYQRLDSINKYQIYHAKAKIRHYTPIERNAVYDSIFGRAN